MNAWDLNAGDWFDAANTLQQLLTEVIVPVFTQTRLGAFLAVSLLISVAWLFFSLARKVVE